MATSIQRRADRLMERRRDPSTGRLILASARRYDGMVGRPPLDVLEYMLECAAPVNRRSSSSDDRSTSRNRGSSSSNRRFTSRNRDCSPSNRRSTSRNRDCSASNRRSTARGRDSTSDNRDSSPSNRRSSARNRDSSAPDRGSTTTDRDSSSDNRRTSSSDCRSASRNRDSSASDRPHATRDCDFVSSDRRYASPSRDSVSRDRAYASRDRSYASWGGDSVSSDRPRHPRFTSRPSSGWHVAPTTVAIGSSRSASRKGSSGACTRTRVPAVPSPETRRGRGTSSAACRTIRHCGTRPVCTAANHRRRLRTRTIAKQVRANGMRKWSTTPASCRSSDARGDFNAKFARTATNAAPGTAIHEPALAMARSAPSSERVWMNGHTRASKITAYPALVAAIVTARNTVSAAGCLCHSSAQPVTALRAAVPRARRSIA